MTLHPEVLWAQRSSATQEEKNVVYVTVNLPDILPDTLKYDLSSTSVSFKAQSKKDSEDYEFHLDFYSEVLPEKSKQQLTSRSFSLVIRKKDVKLDYWPRIAKEKIKTPYIKTDFNRWVDQDEQDGAREDDADADVGDMGGMPGMGSFGMGGGDMDFEKMMADLNKNKPSGSGTSALEADESDDSDDDGPPALEDAEPAK